MRGLPMVVFSVAALIATAAPAMAERAATAHHAAPTHGLVIVGPSFSRSLRFHDGVVGDRRFFNPAFTRFDERFARNRASRGGFALDGSALFGGVGGTLDPIGQAPVFIAPASIAS